MSVLKTLVGPLWRLGTLKGASDPTVVITGSPRSGTTWLLEMVERATDSRRIWEPFYSPDEQRGDRNFGLGWRPYLPPGEEHRELKTALRRLLQGKGISYELAVGSHQYGRLRLTRRLVVAQATVVKFCRFQRLLPWFTRRFSVPVVLLVRNPLAVVASQLNHPSWDYQQVAKEHPVVSSSIRRMYPELAQRASRLEHLEEKLAATWAFDYMIPLSSRLGECVRTVRYKDLVEAPAKTLAAILEHGKLSSKHNKSSLRVEQPSSTTQPDSNVARGGNPRTTWRQRLDDRQVTRISSVICSFPFEGRVISSIFEDLDVTD